MKVFIIARNDLKNGAIFWIWDAVAEGFRDNGYSAKVINTEDLFTLENEKDIALIIIDIAQLQLENLRIENSIKNLAKKNISIISNYYLPEDFPSKRRRVLKSLLDQNYIKFIIGEQGDEQCVKLKKKFDNKYFYVPQGVKKSTINLIKNKEPDKKYNYDIVFIGAKLPKKRWLNKNIIPHIKKKYKIYLHGYGWRKTDFFIKVLHKLGKLINANKLSSLSQKFYKVLSEEEEAKLYRNSRICINFHERDPNGTKTHRIINQRLFKIAGCGGIQLVDKDYLIDEQFPKELIIQEELNKEAWFKKIEKLLEIKQTKIENLRENLIRFTLENHTTQLRAKFILKLASLPENI